MVGVGSGRSRTQAGRVPARSCRGEPCGTCPARTRAIAGRWAGPIANPAHAGACRRSTVTHMPPSFRSLHAARRVSPARAVLLAATVLTAGCIRARRDPATGHVAVDVHSPLQKGTVWDAKLTGSGQYTNVSGTARADVLDGRTTLAVRVTGLTPGATHPWRVHEGSCGSVGAQFGDASAYGNLLVNDQGIAEGTAKLPSLDIARKYKLRLFASPTDSTSEVVCANLNYR